MHNIQFRPLDRSDFQMLAVWLGEPHVRSFYQKKPITFDEVVSEYEQLLHPEEPTIAHIALNNGTPFAYLQSYRNADYPEWEEVMGLKGGISVDLFIGDKNFLGRGYGHAALSAYIHTIAFPNYPAEKVAYISHESTNTAALKCSHAAGFRETGSFIEEGAEMTLLSIPRSSEENAAK